MKRIKCLLSLIVLCVSLVSCGTLESGNSVSDKGGNQSTGVEAKGKGTRDNSIRVLVPEATGTEVYGNADASIDASNATEGYVMVAYLGDSAKVRMLIETPAGNTYNYLINLDKQYHVYPLSEGNGTYKIGVYENISGDQYVAAFTQSVTVTLKDEYSAFLYPNAYVNFNATSKAVQKGKELAAGCNNDIDVVKSVYHYITDNIDYDYEKAATVQSGYVPTVDSTLETKTGICFDYASLMGSMLRSQGIPTRLEIGYAGTEYHAWVSVYTKETGWIDKIIQFDGKNWSLMDPTLASYASNKIVKENRESTTYYQLKYKY
ncbi:MAG: transglutaminase-like domain-containing protein [Pseudobutyrivibrio sp.]|nr:transglutaminase-like domain-containing protein [Pseudobutyrivibrio sp.]